jgi:tetratricopeptide (TPR) repeat protein
MLPVVVALLALVGGMALAERAAAADAPVGGNPAWLREVQDGIATQDAEFVRGNPKAVVPRYENRASRVNDLPSVYLLARAYGKAGDTANALVAYGDVLKMDPRMWFALRDRGVLKALAKDLVGAEADLRQAVALQPRYVDALQPLGDLLVDAKRYEEGIRMLQRVLDVDPSRDSARVQIVEAYATWGRPAEAIAALDVLIKKSPRNLGMRLLKARLTGEAGDPAASLALLKSLANEYPDRPDPLWMWMSIIAKEKTFDPDDALDVLARLRRVAKTDDERKRADDLIDGIRRQMAQAAGAAASGKPTPELVARQLEEGDATARGKALQFLLQYAREDFVIRPPLTFALLKRLTPQYEPVATNRLLTLGVFERFPSGETAPLVRIPLWNPTETDGRVRAKAADVLAELRNPLGIAALAPAALSKDEELARAARHAIYRLAGSAPSAAAETPEEFAEAFLAWWAGGEARDAKLRALDAAARAADVRPYELGWALVTDPDEAVWTAAYRFLARLADQAKGVQRADALWVATLPRFDAAALAAARRDEVVAAVTAWWGRQPK